MTDEVKELRGRKRVIAAFSPEERASLARVKRFLEWFQGDPEFRECVQRGDCPPETRERLRRIGVPFEPEAVAPFWQYPELMNRIILGESGGPEPEGLPDLASRYPLVDLWLRYSGARYRLRRDSTRNLTLPGIRGNPVFDAWRQRRIAAARSELGFFGHVIDHPILAFELGDGCSVGCWFCAFATRKLTRNLDYANGGAELFAAVARACVALFGDREAGLALLYYGTEPHDNPHYMDYVRDYERITGCPVCTSTAVVTDAPWMRGMLDYYRERNLPWPRLSVLSKSLLFRIHELYTPDELRDVELLMQMRDHCRSKVTSGRILDEQPGLRGLNDGESWCGCVIPQGSIACVSGFLVNMVNRTVQVVSPCYTSQRWPHGYRVFAEAAFADAADFRTVVENLIAERMPAAPRPEWTARFRDDLVYRAVADGFDLTSPNQLHHFRGNAAYRALGARLAEGCWTYDRLIDLIAEAHPGRYLEVLAILKTLYDGGFLDEAAAETPVH